MSLSDLFVYSTERRKDPIYFQFVHNKPYRTECEHKLNSE